MFASLFLARLLTCELASWLACPLGLVAGSLARSLASISWFCLLVCVTCTGWRRRALETWKNFLSFLWPKTDLLYRTSGCSNLLFSCLNCCAWLCGVYSRSVHGFFSRNDMVTFVIRVFAFFIILFSRAYHTYIEKTVETHIVHDETKEDGGVYPAMNGWLFFIGLGLASC